MVGLALLQRKCLALTMLSPGMHCRPPPSGRVAAPGSEAKFGRFSFGPSDASGDLSAPLLFRERGRERAKEKDRGKRGEQIHSEEKDGERQEAGIQTEGANKSKEEGTPEKNRGRDQFFTRCHRSLRAAFLLLLFAFQLSIKVG